MHINLECNTSDCGSGLFSIIKQYEQKCIRLWVEYGISLFSMLDIKGWIFMECMEAFRVIENDEWVFKVQEKYLIWLEYFKYVVFFLCKHKIILDVLFCCLFHYCAQMMKITHGLPKATFYEVLPCAYKFPIIMRITWTIMILLLLYK